MTSFRLLAALGVISFCATLVGAEESPVSFEHDVRPILKAYCLDCHGAHPEPEGGLDLRLRRFLVAGGESGPAITAGAPAESLLLIREGRQVGIDRIVVTHPSGRMTIEQMREAAAGGAYIEFVYHSLLGSGPRSPKIADYVDPPRVVPLLGPVQLHHAHYKCTIYYSETTRVGWPVPHTLVDEDSQEVIYIDHNHFHMVGPVNTGASANF